MKSFVLQCEHMYASFFEQDVNSFFLISSGCVTDDEIPATHGFTSFYTSWISFFVETSYS